MDLEFSPHPMVTVTKGIGTGTSGKVKELSSGIMDPNLKGNFLKVKRMGMDVLNGLMAAFT
jgi:hypothetical protein